MPSWQEISEQILYCDGSLRDVYVLDTGPKDWKLFLEALSHSEWTYSYTWEGELQPLPLTFLEARSKEGPALLSIDKDALRLNCHFFGEDEIELDFDPRDIKSHEVFERLNTFLQWLADLLQKSIIITPENTRDDVILTISPASRGA